MLASREWLAASGSLSFSISSSWNAHPSTQPRIKWGRPASDSGSRPGRRNGLLAHWQASFHQTFASSRISFAAGDCFAMRRHFGLSDLVDTWRKLLNGSGSNKPHCWRIIWRAGCSRIRCPLSLICGGLLCKELALVSKAVCCNKSQESFSSATHCPPLILSSTSSSIFFLAKPRAQDHFSSLSPSNAGRPIRASWPTGLAWHSRSILEAVSNASAYRPWRWPAAAICWFHRGTCVNCPTEYRNLKSFGSRTKAIWPL